MVQSLGAFGRAARVHPGRLSARRGGIPGVLALDPTRGFETIGVRLPVADDRATDRRGRSDEFRRGPDLLLAGFARGRQPKGIARLREDPQQGAEPARPTTSLTPEGRSVPYTLGVEVTDETTAWARSARVVRVQKYFRSPRSRSSTARRSSAKKSSLIPTASRPDS